MKYLLLCLLIAFFLSNSDAQVIISEIKRVGAKKVSSLDSNGWKRTGLFILNINQSAQSDWSGGGEDYMIGINGILNQSLHHKHGKYTLDAYLDMEVGVVDAASFKKFRKTSDRMDMTAELEHALYHKHHTERKQHFDLGLLGNVNTQLFAGHNYNNPLHPKMSDFLTPGKLLLSVGVDYKDIKPKDYFSLFLTPFTVRWVTKLDDKFYPFNKFGVDSFQKVYTEIGAYLTLNYNAQLTKTASYIGRLDLFSNYKRNPENVDLLVNNVLSLKISKYLSGTFIVDVLYDDNVKKRTQIQEMTGLGLKLNL